MDSLSEAVNMSDNEFNESPLLPSDADAQERTAEEIIGLSVRDENKLSATSDQYDVMTKVIVNIIRVKNNFC